MAFTVNTSKAQETNLKPEGDYEVIITSCKRRDPTPNGKYSIGITYVIRNDIEQPFRNGYLFNDIWKKREPNVDDMMSEGYNYSQLMAVAGAADLPAGADFETFDDFLNALVNRPVKVRVYHDTYNGKTSERIKSHSKTAYPEVKHIWKQAQNTTNTGFAAMPANGNKAPASDADDNYPF